MSRIIYGTDTGSIEDFGQVILVDVPDDLDGDEIEDYLRENKVSFTPVVAWSNVHEALGYLAVVNGLDADELVRYVADKCGLVIQESEEVL